MLPYLNFFDQIYSEMYFWSKTQKVEKPPSNFAFSTRSRDQTSAGANSFDHITPERVFQSKIEKVKTGLKFWILKLIYNYLQNI